MAATLEAASTLTERYQTTLPETVRRALQLGNQQANRGATRLQAGVAARAARMRAEFPAPPRVRAGRGFISRYLCAAEQKIGAPSLRLEPQFFRWDGGNRTESEKTN